MIKKLLCGAAFAIGTAFAPGAWAQDTYVLYGNVADGEVQLTCTPGQQSDVNNDIATSFDQDGGNTIGFTQTLPSSGGWFISYFPVADFDPTVFASYDYDLEYEVKTTWDGEIKFKLEMQGQNSVEKAVDGIVRDGEWHKVTLNLREFADNAFGEDFSNIQSSWTFCPGFVGGAFAGTAESPVVISYRNIRFVPHEIIPDEEAPVLAVPTVTPNNVSAAITVNATDNMSSQITYEVSASEDFATIAATATGKNGADTKITLRDLTASTDYTFYVRAKDASGNVSNVQKVEFTTTAEPTEAVWYGSVTETSNIGETYTLNYSITYNGSSLVFNATIDNVAALPGLADVSVNDGDWNTMTKIAEGEYTLTLEKGYTEDETLKLFFHMPYTNGLARFDFDYVVGSSNTPPVADTEKPVLNSAAVSSIEATKAVLTVNATDDSSKAVITITGDNFTTLSQTIVADGTDQTIELSGLTPETAYTLTISAADAAGNAADNTLSVDFTTPEAPVTFPETECTGSIGADDWDTAVSVYPTGVPEFLPNLDYTLTALADNHLKVNVTLADIPEEAVKESFVVNCFIDGTANLMTATTAGVDYELTTTSTFERNQELTLFFNLAYISGGTLQTKSFTYAFGSTTIGAGVAKIGNNDNISIYASNGAISINGAAGKTVRIYAVSGMLAHESVASEAMKVQLSKGMYVVVVDGKTAKVIL